MQSQPGQTLAAFVMFVPLIVVPAIAVLGLPDLGKLRGSNSSSADSDFDLALSGTRGSDLSDALNPGSLLNSFPTDEPRRFDSGFGVPADAFADADSFGQPVESGAAAPSSRASATSSNSAGATVFRDRMVLPAGALSDASRSGSARQADPKQTPRRTPIDSRGLATADPIASDSGRARPDTPRRAGSGSGSNGELTWDSARRQLARAGIRDFRLEPGSRRDEFHFTAFFIPQDNPAVLHRFDAEAVEPLAAVADVLRQINAWSNRR